MAKNGRHSQTGYLLPPVFFGSVQGQVDSVWWHSAQKYDETKNQRQASQLPGTFVQLLLLLWILAVVPIDFFLLLFCPEGVCEAYPRRSCFSLAASF